MEETAKKTEEKIFLIKYKKGFSKAKLNKFSDVKYLDNRISKLKGSSEDMEDIIKDSDVDLIELDQNLDLFGDFIPFNVRQVKADLAWNLSTGSGVKIAVLDTGVYDHDDLSVAGGWNVLDDNSDYSDNDGHGTRVAGVLASTVNGEGLVGMSPDVGLYAVKIMDGSGNLSDAIAGVEWAIDNDMNIVSMSFGFDFYSQIFKEVLDDAYDSDILLVGASGNDDSDVLYPAAYTDVIAVGAVDEDNDRASFSNYGYDLELVAPGVDINSTGLNGYSVSSGTSLATPHVAGVAALIWSYNASLSNEEVRGKLQNDALDLGSSGKDDYFGYGLVRVNLTSVAFNYTPESYFYEVFNISNYDLPNESYAFWLNGTGTIDDVNFSEGSYLINKNINDISITQYIFVNENGTIILTIRIATDHIEFQDDFTADSSPDNDGLAWVNDDDTYVTMDVPTTYTDAFCIDLYDDGTFDDCRYKTGTLSDCNSYSQGLSGAGYEFYDLCSDAPNSDCFADANLDDTFPLSTDSKITHDVTLRVWRDCDDSSNQQRTVDDTEPFYVFDQRRAYCTDSTGYKLEGRYTTVYWETYKYSQSCASNKLCDSQQDDENPTSSKTASLDPCRLKNGESCTQTSQCLTGATCISNVCTGSEADLAVIDVIPIQVIPDVNMIKDKSGYVRVIVENKGDIGVTGQVNVTFDGNPLTPYNPVNAEGYIVAGTNATFDFNFKPNTAGNNKAISASVAVIE